MSPSSLSPAERFAGTIRFPTVSSPGDFSLKPFLELQEFSRRAWPSVFNTLEVIVFREASLLLRWRGLSESSEPLMLTAHQDVVPPGEGWSFDPFAGKVEGGRIWGRGAVDYKCGYAGMLEAASLLLAGGFQPARTICFAFGHDEEVGGARGAGAITEYLTASGVVLSSVLDEGGYIYGTRESETAVVGLAEKGYATFRITAFGRQGHSSVPPKSTAIGTLSRAIAILENENTDDPADTTFAPTIISGGEKENVLPGSACALVNTRPAPGSSVDGIDQHIRNLLEPLGVGVELLRGPSLSEPSRVSSDTNDDFMCLTSAVKAVLGSSIHLVTGVFPAATDSRRYGTLARNVYRFMPVRLGAAGLSVLHSPDESISEEDYTNCVRFYCEYIVRAAGKGSLR
ncbi:MAG TPA: M20/M25/M40 family metallo-hydrolase [Candidatus Sabulitectum sp.]|nr:M20/M25/M40 family metallo-hydrolase [Candidatus Sabulitectum sp.]HPF31663.1 M20/M25/M40 family metallo-hydrolase [Candidatus Sabulitectum sp.]HPJ28510.1 M20/M25/M40 family metallo-hydrolase [Candidatus Sabulitectum sp.]HPR22254.1 M20/M25/M40 family metallo-hydrolase [Candidatus Sabulitectum sp.]HRW77549.1 M20/M25/M40 family metallo-hydrolase [Candidatus Sabulitectum sp.]